MIAALKRLFAKRPTTTTVTHNVEVVDLGVYQVRLLSDLEEVVCLTGRHYQVFRKGPGGAFERMNRVKSIKFEVDVDGPATLTIVQVDHGRELAS